mgnify:CR=1 FL=1
MIARLEQGDGEVETEVMGVGIVAVGALAWRWSHVRGDAVPADALVLVDAKRGDVGREGLDAAGRRLVRGAMMYFVLTTDDEDDLGGPNGLDDFPRGAVRRGLPTRTNRVKPSVAAIVGPTAVAAPVDGLMRTMRLRKNCVK